MKIQNLRQHFDFEIESKYYICVLAFTTPSWRASKDRFSLRKISMGSDRNKIEPAHGLSVPIFCFSLNLWSTTQMIKSWSIFNFLWSGGVDNTRWKKVQSDAYFPEWKPTLRVSFIDAVLLQGKTAVAIKTCRIGGEDFAIAHHRRVR